MNDELAAEVSRLAALPWQDQSQFQTALGEAERLLVEHLEANPESVPALTSLGAVLSDLGRHREALVALRRAEALGSTDANSYFNLGVALMNTTDRDVALPYFEKAASLQASAHTLQAYFDPHGH